MNSSSVSKVERAKEKERLKKDNKLKVKAKIAPSIEPVIAEIEREQKATILAQLDLIDGSEENFKAMAMALKLYKESLSKLKSRLTTIMRVEA
jgi:formate dehydrogenase maturation protein FdhE